MFMWYITLSIVKLKPTILLLYFIGIELFSYMCIKLYGYENRILFISTAIYSILS